MKMSLDFRERCRTFERLLPEVKREGIVEHFCSMFEADIFWVKPLLQSFCFL